MKNIASTNSVDGPLYLPELILPGLDSARTDSHLEVDIPFSQQWIPSLRKLCLYDPVVHRRKAIDLERCRDKSRQVPMEVVCRHRASESLRMSHQQAL